MRRLIPSVGLALALLLLWLTGCTGGTGPTPPPPPARTTAAAVRNPCVPTVAENTEAILQFATNENPNIPPKYVVTGRGNITWITFDQSTIPSSGGSKRVAFSYDTAHATPLGGIVSFGTRQETVSAEARQVQARSGEIVRLLWLCAKPKRTA